MGLAKLRVDFPGWMAALAAGLALAGMASATPVVTYQVSLSTAPLLPPTGQYTLDFRFYDGSFSNDTNNTFAASHFNVGSPAFGIIATDAYPFNDRTFGFTPQSSLTFQLSITTDPGKGPLPDDLKVVLFNPNGYALPTTDTATSALFEIFVTGNPPHVAIYNTVALDPSTGVSNPLTSPASVGFVQAPDAGSLGLLAIGLILIGTKWFAAIFR